MLSPTQQYLLSQHDTWLTNLRTLVTTTTENDTDEDRLTYYTMLYDLEIALPPKGNDETHTAHLLTLLREISTIATTAPLKSTRIKAYKYLLRHVSKASKQAGKLTREELAPMEALPRYDHLSKKQLQHELRKVELG